MKGREQRLRPFFYLYVADGLIMGIKKGNYQSSCLSYAVRDSNPGPID